MPMLAVMTSLSALSNSVATLAAEPASILYIVTGAVGFAVAGLRKSKSGAKPTSTAMLFCQRSSRAALEDLNLL